MDDGTFKIGTTTFFRGDVKHYQPIIDNGKTKWHITLNDNTSLFLDDKAGGQIMFGRNTETGQRAVQFSGVNGMNVFQQGANFDLSACDNYTLELKDGNAAKVNIHNQIGSKKDGKILSQDANDIISKDNDVYGIWEHDTQLSKIRSFNSETSSKEIGIESLYMSEEDFDKLVSEGKIDPNNFVTN